MRKICIFGDSIVWGSYDFEKGGWVSRLKLYFSDKGNRGREYERVYNLGISADSTDDLIERFEVECKAREPEIILFAIGINDSLYINKKDNPFVSLDKFKNNLQFLINTAKKYSKKIGFIGITNVDESKTKPISWDSTIFYENERVKEYDTVLKEVSEENNLLYLYMFDLLSKEDIYDGLHPNTEGHEKMFQRVKNFLEENFK